MGERVERLKSQKNQGAMGDAKRSIEVFRLNARGGLPGYRPRQHPRLGVVKNAGQRLTPTVLIGMQKKARGLVVLPCANHVKARL